MWICLIGYCNGDRRGGSGRSVGASQQIIRALKHWKLRVIRQGIIATVFILVMRLLV